MALQGVNEARQSAGGIAVGARALRPTCHLAGPTPWPSIPEPRPIAGAIANLGRGAPATRAVALANFGHWPSAYHLCEPAQASGQRGGGNNHKPSTLWMRCDLPNPAPGQVASERRLTP
jgi:hypothetical protein